MPDNIDKFLFRYLLSAAILTLTIGTIVYHYVEKLTWVDAYYFSVVSLATVGYGDIVPHTTAGKLFTTVYILVGIGILTTFISVIMRRRTEKVSNRHEKKSKAND